MVGCILEQLCYFGERNQTRLTTKRSTQRMRREQRKLSRWVKEVH